MPNSIEHERMRFRTMDRRKLRVRLSKITDLTKLRNFIAVAEEFGYSDLAQEARVRLACRLQTGRGMENPSQSPGPLESLPLYRPVQYRTWTSSTSGVEWPGEEEAPMVKPQERQEPTIRYLRVKKKGGSQ